MHGRFFDWHFTVSARRFYYDLHLHLPFTLYTHTGSRLPWKFSTETKTMENRQRRPESCIYPNEDNWICDCLFLLFVLIACLSLKQVTVCLSLFVFIKKISGWSASRPRNREDSLYSRARIPLMRIVPSMISSLTARWADKGKRPEMGGALRVQPGCSLLSIFRFAYIPFPLLECFMFPQTPMKPVLI